VSEDSIANPRARERVTIDLRGIGPRLQAHAAARGRTTASVVRAAVLTLLDTDSGLHEPDRAFESNEAHVVKVTVRLGAADAVRLAHCARRVGVSQGTYVAGLLDGQPPLTRAADHVAAVAALADSTQKMAAMSADIHALIRFVSQGSTAEAEKYRASFTSLSGEVRAHLEIASRLLAGLTTRSRSRGSALRTSRRKGLPT